MASSVNTLDLIFFVISFIFVMVAIFRGFIGEIFSLINWALAFVLSHLLAPFAIKLLLFYTKNHLLADLITRTTLFVVILVILSLTTGSMKNDLKEKTPAIFDRSLGAIFGIFKSLLIFGIIYAVFTNIGLMVMGNKKHETVAHQTDSLLPEWMKKAQCYNIIKLSGETIKPAVDAVLDAVTKNVDAKSIGKIVTPKDELDNKIGEIIGDKETTSSSTTNDHRLTDSATEETGYRQKDIQKMNRLIDIVR